MNPLRSIDLEDHEDHESQRNIFFGIGIMVMRKGGQRAAAKRKAGQRKLMRRIPRGPRVARHEIARLVEETEGDLTSAIAYSSYNLNLSGFTRASTVAKGYQFYRITKVEYQVLPQFDTFTANGNTKVPYLYWLIDRNKQYQFFNSHKQLEKAGAKPIRLDDKTVRFGYRPSVLQGVLDNQVSTTNPQFNQYKITPWLNTRNMNVIGTWVANGVDHTGVAWYVDDQGADAITFRIVRRVHFEFKKPAGDITSAEDINVPSVDPFDAPVQA